MARVVLAAAVVAVVALAAFLLRLGVNAARASGRRDGLLETQMEREGLQRIAFVLLIGLILYVAITGGQV